MGKTENWTQNSYRSLIQKSFMRLKYYILAQALIEKNNFGVSNIRKTTAREC